MLANTITYSVYHHIKQVAQVAQTPNSIARELEFYFFYKEAQYSAKAQSIARDIQKPGQDEEAAQLNTQLEPELENEEDLIVSLSKHPRSHKTESFKDGDFALDSNSAIKARQTLK